MAKETISRSHIINKEISDKLEVLRQNRSLDNKSTPVYQLPPEVLEIVFTLAIAGCNQDPRRRNLTLNTSGIWGVLLLGHPKWAAASLERSKDADLAINLHWNSTTSDDSINLMKKIFENHVSRIRAVYLCVTGFEQLHLGLSVFLHKLEDKSLSLHSFRLTIQNTTSFPLPVRIFSETSRMRYLHIRNCYVKWQSFSFPNLTHLRIHTATDSFLPDFFTALREMPELQVLDFDLSFPRIPSKTSLVPVTLLKLRSLNLHARAKIDELAYFLPFINIPSATTIHLSSEAVYHLDDIQIHSISTFLSRDFGAVSHQSLHVDFPSRGFIVEIWKNETGISSTQMLRLIWIPMAIPPPMPLYDLQTLILHICISSETLIQLFGYLPLLRSIVVSGQTVFDVISALSNKPQNYVVPRSASYSVTFPALRSLSIRAINYTAGSIRLEQDVDLMLSCFIERRERNAGLEELDILQCKCITESHVDLLRQIVDNVRWDMDGVEDRPLSRQGHGGHLLKTIKTLVRSMTK